MAGLVWGSCQVYALLVKYDLLLWIDPSQEQIVAHIDPYVSYIVMIEPADGIIKYILSL